MKKASKKIRKVETRNKVKIFGLLKDKERILLASLVALSIIMGVYAHYPVSITHDPAIHSEIVNILRQQGYPNSWEPYASNDFTYPPLFHYIVLLFSLVGFPLADAVIMVGIILWAMIPLCAYLLGSLYDRKVALLSAAVFVLLPFLSNVFIFGEFPQLLAMELLMLELYYLKKGRYLMAGIMTGLVFLSHPFMPIVSFLVYLYFVLPPLFSEKKPLYPLLLLLPFAISAAWLPKYVMIAMNMFSGDWQNVVYNAYQPVFWFWPAETLSKYLFGLDYFTPLILVLSFIGLSVTKDRFIKIFFIACFAFSVFHVPYTQLKIFDVLTIPAALLASFGVIEVSKYFRNRGPLVIIFFVAMLLAFQLYHFSYAKNVWFDPEISAEPSLQEAALWLGEHDKNNVKVYVDRAPAWFGVLSGKIPLEPEISYLEKFSDAYMKQRETNQKIKEGLKAGESIRDLAEQAGLKYVITNEKSDLSLIYTNSAWSIYEI
jgi:hypothetical protein